MVHPGGTVLYTFEVENTGDDPLTGLTISDDHCGVPVYQSGDAPRDFVLDTDETWVFTCSEALTEDTTNTVEVSANDSLGNPVLDTDSASVNVLEIGLDVAKSRGRAADLCGRHGDLHGAGDEHRRRRDL